MREIAIFVEDFGHEEFLKALIQRFSDLYDICIKIIPRNVRGGHGRVTSELKQYLRDLTYQEHLIPDLIIVARDANCQGVAYRERELREISKKFFRVSDLIIYAIPDPHIERWLLLDAAAFKAVLGKGCNAPDYKCDRNRYKTLLLEAIRSSGVEPLLGGMEYAEDIIMAMNMQRVKNADDSLARLISDLEHHFKMWKQG